VNTRRPAAQFGDYRASRPDATCRKRISPTGAHTGELDLAWASDSARAAAWNSCPVAHSAQIAACSWCGSRSISMETYDFLHLWHWIWTFHGSAISAAGSRGRVSANHDGLARRRAPP